MKLNCDLGESFGSWKMGMDADVMPFIDMANIACGFHAGDPDVMQRTLTLARQYRVTIGAHPAYPDLNGFGRRSMQCSATEIINLMHYQIAALDGMAQNQGLSLAYVKPHGALYNDMMSQPAVMDAVIQAVASYYKPLKLMVLATAEWQALQQQAHKASVDLLFEAFADRRYTDEGRLLPRSQPGAVLHEEDMLAQVAQMAKHSTVTTQSGKTLKLKADTLCVHGDNPAGVAQIQKIRELLAV